MAYLVTSAEYLSWRYDLTCDTFGGSESGRSLTC
jgi:hypothetical protein